MMSQYADFTVDTSVQVYFCDPHSPWQRESNENFNGLLRPYFPVGIDFISINDATERNRSRPQPLSPARLSTRTHSLGSLLPLMR
jgi:IS30 family transposase